jgi:hypothetical protein
MKFLLLFGLLAVTAVGLIFAYDKHKHRRDNLVDDITDNLVDIKDKTIRKVGKLKTKFENL